MKQLRLVQALALLLATISWARIAAAQALPTAAAPLQLSAFGGVSGVFTGLEGGKNFSITAGGDLGLPLWHGLRPALEVRGTYPMDRGLIVAQKDALGGLSVNFLLNHRIHPYGDFLFGRGQMNYRLGYSTATPSTTLTTTYIYSPGVGFDYDLTDHLSLKVDAQLQHWGAARRQPRGASTPPSGPSAWSTASTSEIATACSEGPFPCGQSSHRLASLFFAWLHPAWRPCGPAWPCPVPPSAPQASPGLPADIASARAV